MPQGRSRDGLGGFTCVLDLSRARRDIESGPGDRAVALVALFALVVYLAGSWITPRPVRPLHLEAGAVRCAVWESPTGFLLADDFSLTQPD